MPKKRFIPYLMPEQPETPFTDAATAWFWFMHCQKARWDGARFERDLGTESRPCEPDDIYRCARRLVATGKITQRHFDVLLRFGVLDRPPDPHLAEEFRAYRFWDEALDRMTTILRAKGIVQ